MITRLMITHTIRPMNDNNTQVPNDNTHDTPYEGRAILRNKETGLRSINFPVVVLN
jgi:hypothetical protein